jgi:hypothetical protein
MDSSMATEDLKITLERAIMKCNELIKNNFKEVQMDSEFEEQLHVLGDLNLNTVDYDVNQNCYHIDTFKEKGNKFVFLRC